MTIGAIWCIVFTDYKHAKVNIVAKDDFKIISPWLCMVPIDLEMTTGAPCVPWNWYIPTYYISAKPNKLPGGNGCL